MRDRCLWIAIRQQALRPDSGNFLSRNSSNERTFSTLQHCPDRHDDICTLTQTNPHMLWAPLLFGVKVAQTINDASSVFCMKYSQV
jgi:hypothetical protein